MINDIVTLTAKSCTHNMAWQIFRELRDARSHEEAEYKLNAAIRDAEVNLTADLDDCQFFNDSAVSATPNSLTKYWLNERKRLFVPMDDRRCYVDLDQDLRNLVIGHVNQNSDLANRYTDIIMFSTLFESYMPESERDAVLDNINDYVKASKDLSAQLSAVNRYARKLAGREAPPLSDWPKQKDRHEYFAPSLLYVLLDMSMTPTSLASCFDTSTWERNRVILEEQLSLGDLTFMCKVPTAIAGSIFERFGFYEIVSQHLAKTLTLHKNELRGKPIIKAATPLVSAKGLTADEFGEWLYDAMHEHGQIEADTKYDLIKLCNKSDLKLSLKAPSGNYWASLIAQEIGHRLDVPHLKIKLFNHRKRLSDESRKRTLQRHPHPRNVEMERLISKIKSVELALK